MPDQEVGFAATAEGSWSLPEEVEAEEENDEDA